MTHRTVLLSSFDEFLANEYILEEERAAEQAARRERLSWFPYSVMLQLSYPELDFANRWCWQSFGPGDGECTQRDSEYPACDLTDSHSHVGKWTSHWLMKIEYDFGFNEWYFAASADRDRFLANVELINWGEHYPK